MIIFEENVQKYRAASLHWSKVLKKLSLLRIIFFVVSLALIIYLVQAELFVASVSVGLLSLGAFLFLVKRYNQTAYKQQHSDILQKINENELSLLRLQLSGSANGQSYTSSSHPYAADLDLFGQHSLFQLMNRTTTAAGAKTLAKWLLEPVSKNIIRERQSAIAALNPQLAWRQELHALGLHAVNPKSDPQKLLDWIDKPVQLGNRHTVYFWLSVCLATSSTLAAIWYTLHLTSLPNGMQLLPFAVIVLFNVGLLYKMKSIAGALVDDLHENSKILGGYFAMIKHIDAETFQSDKLKILQAAFTKDKYNAAAEIERLKQILDVFQLRGEKNGAMGNQFYPIFNSIWLIDVFCIVQAERWKLKNKQYFKKWVQVLSEFEVLSSLAGFAYANPSFAFPEIVDEPYVIDFDRLGHPLITAESRVCNDFKLEGAGKMAIITGSNMAGKSTFLRAVGMNLVLALMGAPCCAKAAKVSQMVIFSSMRTQDNLENGVSSFYAELKRIEELLALLSGGATVFFLLDEVFKGTNSEDKHRGEISLITQLKALNTFGVIATHDLHTAALAEKQNLVQNYSFNSEITDDDIVFNYQLTPSICKDFNASELMKRSGIKILPDL